MIKERTEYIKELNKLNLDTLGKEKAKSIIENSDIKAHGKSFPFSYIPLFINDEDLKFFSNITKTLHSILSKITKEYIKNPRYRKLFHFSKDMENLICLPCSYEEIIPIGRYDIFMDEDTKEYKFCEFNTDGSGGMSRDFEISKAIIDSYSGDFYMENNAHPFNTIESICDKFISFYKTDKNAKENPTLSVVDFREEGVFSDFNRFIECFNNKGINTRFTDVRDLYFDGENLIDKTDGQIIDVIYRRLVTSVMLERIDECRDLIDAVKNEKVVLLGHFRTSIAHSKTISVVIHDDMTKSFLNSEEIDFINKHMPKTYYLNDKINKDIIKEAKNNKDRWLIKPEEGFGSLGVYAGRDEESDRWNILIDDNINNHFILQKFVNYKEVPFLSSESTSIDNYSLMLGVYHCGSNVVGFYSRAGKNGVIDFNHDGICITTIKV